MDYNHLIDRIKEELPEQTIWMHSATDHEGGDEHSEGLAIIMEPSMYEEVPEEERTFTVVYFRVYPVYDDHDGEDALPVDCEVESGYENTWPDLEGAKKEALGILPHLPQFAMLDQAKNPRAFISMLEKLETP